MEDRQFQELPYAMFLVPVCEPVFSVECVPYSMLDLEDLIDNGELVVTPRLAGLWHTQATEYLKLSGKLDYSDFAGTESFSPDLTELPAYDFPAYITNDPLTQMLIADPKSKHTVIDFDGSLVQRLETLRCYGLLSFEHVSGKKYRVWRD